MYTIEAKCSVSSNNIMAIKEKTEKENIEIKFTDKIHQVNKKITVLEKMKSRLWFLTECSKHNIVPNTLQLKTPNTEPNKNEGSNTRNRYINNIKSASIKNLRIARQDAISCLKIFEEEFDHFVENVNNGLTPDQKTQMKENIKKQIYKMKQISNSKHKKKLGHLKMKYNIPKTNKENQRIPGVEKKKTTTRRFIRRSKYQKWKQTESKKQKLNLVVNLSDMVITEPMKSLLNRGLSFVPTPSNIDISQIKAQINKYERTVIWKEHHFNEDLEPTNLQKSDPNELMTKNIFKLDKTNLPRGRKPPSILQTYLNATRSDVLGSCQQNTQKSYDNLLESEREAIKVLVEEQSNGNIVIKPADKTGAVVVMNKNDYCKEMSSQLQATFIDENKKVHKFYSKSNEENLQKQKTVVNIVIKQGVEYGFISDDDRKYMEPKGKGGRLYGLPKLHKGIPEGKRIPPCRPIVSNSGANTEHLSAFVDFYSKHLVKLLPSYVQDSPDLLRKFQAENESGPQPKKSFPVTIDVRSLYTNIPTRGDYGGLQAFEIALENRSSEEKKMIPTWYLIQLLDLVLSGNIFEFDDQIYQQEIGTAMGTKVAPTYACLFMGWLESLMLDNWTKKHPTYPKPYLWRRYIDDIMFIWKGEVSELEEFLTHINSQHTHIKFTATYNQDTRSIPFLDMQITINKDGLIETDLYKKESSVVKYLKPSSCHPSHITSNIPYALGLRTLRICSERATFLKRIEEMRQDLLSCDYHPKILESAFKRTLNVERSEALKKVEKTSEKDKNSPFVITYHPKLPSISNITKKHWKVMCDDSPKLKRCFPNPPVVAYKRHKNLKDLLIRSKVQSKRSSKRILEGFKNCGRACILCAYLPKDSIKHHKCYKTGKINNINNPVNCTTTNVIYKIECKKCPEWVYIGETGQRFCERFTAHRGYVNRQEVDKPTGLHFNIKGHTVLDMIPMIIEEVRPKNDPNLRLIRESWWITQYQSVEFGANTQS